MQGDAPREGMGTRVVEAVLIAGLSALVHGLVEIVLERFKKKRQANARKGGRDGTRKGK